MQKAIRTLWHGLREHATHWVIGGSLLAVTGFAPEEWLAHTVHGLHIPENVLHLWAAGVDVRIVAVMVGMSVAVFGLLRQHQIARPLPPAIASGPRLPDAGPIATTPVDAAIPLKAVEQTLVRSTPGTLPLPDKPSIAVLPFTNVSGDPEQEYFSDGVAEDIITAMSRSHALFVIARNSSFTYKGRSVDVKQVASALGVRYVLEGSVRRAGDRVRVSVQLIDAEAGNHIWAERYDRDLANIFAVQDEITSAVILAIGPAIVGAEQQRAVRKPSESLGAWDAYMRGLWHLARLDPGENDKARELFERAIQLDPNLSQAYQGLVYSYIDEIRIFNTRGHDETLPIVEPLAHRAIALDPNDANAHAALGWVLETAGDHEGALDRAEQALALNPNCADAYRLKGVSLVFSGKHRDGYETLLTHLRLNPRDPANWRAFHLIGMAHYQLGHYAEAVDAERRAIHENPNQRLSFRWLVAALAQLGRITEAQSIIRDLSSSASPEWLNQWTRHWPWMHEEDHARLLDGLRKAGWQGEGV